MKNIFLKLVLITLIVSTYSCKEIPLIISDPEIPESERVVLLEELTGASCPNCPKGSAAVQSIVNKFPDRVIAIGIHGDFLAQPTSKSKYDFRNPKAKDLEKWFQPWFGKPSASVNRILDDGFLMIDVPELWQAAVESELQKPHQLNIILKSTYNPSDRSVKVDVAAIPLEDITGIFNISIYLVESGIVDGQSNGSLIEENYIHNHVLRDMLTKHDGDALKTDLVKNEIISRTYSYTLPSTPVGVWKPENMNVVAMISRNSVNNKSIVQAAEVHLK
jgi:hypothetical protein